MTELALDVDRAPESASRAGPEAAAASVASGPGEDAGEAYP